MGKSEQITAAKRGSRKPTATMCACGDHAFAPLTKGFVALVSPEDAQVLLESCWRAHIGRSNYLTVLSSNGGEFILARRIMGAAGSQLIDHKNRDTADCRRPNLRFCTSSQNQANRKRLAGKTLPKGVRKEGEKYSAQLVHNGRRFYLGRFTTPEAASRAYEFAAVTLFGEFARAG